MAINFLGVFEDRMPENPQDKDFCIFVFKSPLETRYELYWYLVFCDSPSVWRPVTSARGEVSGFSTDSDSVCSIKYPFAITKYCDNGRECNFKGTIEQAVDSLMANVFMHHSSTYHHTENIQEKVTEYKGKEYFSFCRVRKDNNSWGCFGYRDKKTRRAYVKDEFGRTIISGTPMELDEIIPTTETIRKLRNV